MQKHNNDSAFAGLPIGYKKKDARSWSLRTYTTLCEKRNDERIQVVCIKLWVGVYFFLISCRSEELELVFQHGQSGVGIGIRWDRRSGSQRLSFLNELWRCLFR